MLINKVTAVSMSRLNGQFRNVRAPFMDLQTDAERDFVTFRELRTLDAIAPNLLG